MGKIIPSDISVAILDAHTTKNARVANGAGSLIFGQMPAINQALPAGSIILKLGFKGVVQGKSLKGAYGLRHIWDKHGAEIGATCAKDVVTFVDSVLAKGADILIDKNKGPNKPLIIESSKGMVVLGFLPSSGEYQIITAYSRKSHPGVLVGRL